jgi:hypothetical protein
MPFVERAKRSDTDLATNDLVLRVAVEPAHDPELATALDDLMLFRADERSPPFWRKPLRAAKYPPPATGHWPPT